MYKQLNLLVRRYVDLPVNERIRCKDKFIKDIISIIDNNASESIESTFDRKLNIRLQHDPFSGYVKKHITRT